MYSRNQMHTSEVASDAVSVFKNSVQIDITMNAVALLVFLLRYTGTIWYCIQLSFV